MPNMTSEHIQTSTFTVGDDVIPADGYDMLAACDTYHHKVTHGVIVAIMPEYAESVYVVWWTVEGPQNVAYGFAPTQLQHD